MIRISFLFFLAVLYSISNHAQDKYMVYLSDKNGTSFDPYSYFDAKAIARKQNANINIQDSTDFPLNEYYVNSIAELATEVKGNSRWFNAVVCLADPYQLEQIKSLPFVIETELLASEQIVSNLNVDPGAYGKLSIVLNGQTRTLGHPRFKEAQFEGDGMRIAIFDVGFKAANVLEELQHVFVNNKVILAYDFVKDRNINYKKGGSHGTMVMSCVAGIHEARNMGLAPKSEFLLARTERQITEFGSEEENWLFAAEWADKNGADIINSSLGYTTQRYYQHDMQGSTALVTRAANFAASKGMLVVNSAGNEGNSLWKTIGAPADADSVLSIGGIDPTLGFHSKWSSFGPTADKRRKPNLSAYGDAVVASGNGIQVNSGTSFSAPLIAGFAACAWQAHPEYTNMQLFEEIQKSANLYPYYDYVHGYGLPQSDYFLEDNLIIEDIAPTFLYDVKKNVLSIKVIGTEIDSLSEEIKQDTLTSDLKLTDTFLTDELIQAIAPDQMYSVPDYVYIHVENKNGVLDSYQVIRPEESYGGMIDIAPLKGKTIRIYYKHYIEEFYVE